jgi:transposase
MWRPYVDIAKTYFRNATIVIDKYHFIRYNIWAIEKVRKRVQKNLGDKLRKYFKRSKKLILAKKDSLDQDSKRELEIMLLYSEDLRQAHYIKELFYQFTQAKNSLEARELLGKWINIARSFGIKEYISCANTLYNWRKEICNSFDVPYTNGCTEGFNNKIKVIKRNAFGFRNFNNFRTRILHCCN